ncbi:MAG: glycosyltransferase [Candidatus Taylorbacteria bacterium]|nr:glycosyltransferase [Candidatus Taylorbacteria bacterium]
MNLENKTICYFGFYRPTAPRDKVYFDGLKERGYKVIECVDNSPGLLKFFRLAKKLRSLKGEYDFLWAGYLSGRVVSVAWLFSQKKIFWNVLNSQYERVILDRGMHSKFSLRAWIFWWIDFFSFHLSDVSLVETESQKGYLVKEFKINPKKLVVVFTGADPDVFYPDPEVAKRENFTVMFRGMFLPETGVEYILEAAKLLQKESIDFVVMGWGASLLKIESLLKSYNLPRVTLKTEFLPPKVLRELILSCHVMLGQFGNHPHLDHTIQNKTFEALALGMPYITRDSRSNRELLVDGENCVFVPPADPHSIANAILDLKNREDFRNKIGLSARTTYCEKASPEVLAEQIVEIIQSAV